MSDLTPEQIKALPCPACLAPAGVSCGEQPHTDRIIAAQARNLTHGRCALCGQPMVHGSLDGAPIDAWHPDPDDAAACPRIPDPAHDWEAYATATNLGLTPGHPGAEHFVSQDAIDHAATIDVHDVAAAGVLQVLAEGGPATTADVARTAALIQDTAYATGMDPAAVAAGLARGLHDPLDQPLHRTGPRPVLCPECAAGKCPNCDGTALDPVTDTIVRCTCDHGGPL